MESAKQATEDALQFMTDTVNNPEMPPETRRKCAEKILERFPPDDKEAAPQTISVTYQVIE